MLNRHDVRASQDGRLPMGQPNEAMRSNGPPRRMTWGTTTPGLTVALLGAVTLRVDGTEIPIPRRQVRVLLALLALRGGTGVTLDDVADALWEDHLPKDPIHAVHVYVSRLRALHPAVAAAVVTTPAGYKLELEEGRLDTARFAALAAEAGRCLEVDPASALAKLDGALSMWVGPACGDLHCAEFAAPAVRRLEELRLGALEDRYTAEVRLGMAGRALPGLRQLAERNPFRDRTVALFLRALQEDGRRLEAIEYYREHCQLVKRELGFVPSAPFEEAMAAVG